MKITKINFFLRPLGPVNKICYYVAVSFFVNMYSSY